MTQREGSLSETIKIHKIIPEKRWRVLRMLTHIEEFSQYMPNVKESRLIKRTKRGAVTEWRIEVDGLPMRWMQEDYFEGRTFTLHFKAIQGDFDQFEGKWVLRKGEGRDITDVTVEVKAKIGIPIFDEVIAKELRNRLQKNFEMMLSALEENMLKRRYERVDGRAMTSRLKGFVVMGHPYNFQHLMKYFKVFKPDADKITPEFLHKIFELAPTFRTADIHNYRSRTGQMVDGYFVLCPIIPDMALLSPEIVLPKVVEGCRIGERLGAGILALGGFTSIVGEKYFEKIKDQIKIPITTGNAFTAAMALEGVRKACRLLDVDLKKSVVVIIGGTGDIGSACARVLVRETKEVIVTGRTPSSVRDIEKQLKKGASSRVSGTLNNEQAVKKADIIIAAASSTQAVVKVDQIRPGTIVCDVGYPKNIGYTSRHRDDIFVFGGGMATAPMPFNVGFDVGLPGEDAIYGCFAEAIILSLEGRYENYSEGKGKLMPEKLEAIKTMAEKHGFELAPFYWGHERMDEERIQKMLKAKIRV